MTRTRCSGILLHPTSLPGPYGIGDLGPEADRWLDWLAEAGCTFWQTLPLGPTGYGDSPYFCFSAFAGNPYLVSPELLLAEGLLDAADLADAPDFPEGRVDFGRVHPLEAGPARPGLRPVPRPLPRRQPPLATAPSAGPTPAGSTTTPCSWPSRKPTAAGRGPNGRRRCATAAAPPWPRPGRRPLPRGGAPGLPPVPLLRAVGPLREQARRLGLRIMGDAPMYVAGGQRRRVGPSRPLQARRRPQPDRRRRRPARTTSPRPASCGATPSTTGTATPPTATPGGSPGCGPCSSWPTWCASTTSGPSWTTGRCPPAPPRRR